MNSTHATLPARRRRMALGLCTALLTGLAGIVFAAGLPATFAAPAGKDLDKTRSPYFFVKSDDADLDQMPLKSTSATVYIAGVIADVTVVQEYKNEGKRPLEAIYIFPASTHAAVYGMTMRIGERTIIAQIEKRAAARRHYETARASGKSASLLEQNRPNVFQMNVANIMPGDLIRVELKYTELLVPENGVYAFVYPTVVGPRYANQPEESAGDNDRWFANPYLRQHEKPNYIFSLQAAIHAGMPIRDVASPSHATQVTFEDSSTARIVLDDTEKYGGNRDFILRYRLAGEEIKAGLLLYEGGDENFFLLMAQPPRSVRASMIPPREYIFILDVSGSMRGFPLESSKALCRDLLAQLRPEDCFNVLLFAGGSNLLAPRSLPATQANIDAAMRLIDGQRGGGGTELLPALRRALLLPRVDEGMFMARTVVIATDGYVSVEASAFELVRNHLGDANFFAFGIGSSVNRHLIEGLAFAGRGEPFIVTEPTQARVEAQKFRKMIAAPLLMHVTMKTPGFDAYEIEPATLPDLFAERPLIVFGKWRGKPAGRIEVGGYTSEGPWRKIFHVAQAGTSTENAALRYLWARHRLRLLADFASFNNTGRSSAIEEITKLGLQYNLLTAYTSFVAVDSQTRNQSAEAAVVKQPLPLPAGVSDAAVGSVALTTIVPAATYSLTGKRQARELLFTPGKKLISPPTDYYMRSAIRQNGAMQFQIDSLSTRGRLAEHDIQNELRAIAVFAMMNAPEIPRGTVVFASFSLSFEIDTSGKVLRVRLIERDRQIRELVQAFIDLLQMQNFPKSSGSTHVVLKATFLTPQ